MELRKRATQELLVAGHIERAVTMLKQIFADEGLVFPESLPRSVWTIGMSRARLGMLPRRLHVLERALALERTLLQRERAHDPRRHAHHQGGFGHAHARRHQGSGTDDRLGADVR